MAVSVSSAYNNSIVGIPQIGGDVDIYEMHSEPRFAIGTMFERQDGARFRYAHLGDADVSQGKLVAQDMSESSEAVDQITVVAPGSAVAVADDSIKPGTVGSRYIEGTIASIAADQYKGGYLVVSNNTGEGYTYRIRGNTASGNPASGNLRIELYDKLQSTLSATSDVVITGPLQGNLEIATITTDDVVGGVTVSSVDVSEKPFCWVQTRGISAVLQQGTWTLGYIAVIGSVSGAASAMSISNNAQRPVGIICGVDVDTGYGTVNLSIE